MGEPRAKTEKKGGRTSSGQAKMAAKEIRPEGAVVVERRNDVRARFLLKSWLSPLAGTASSGTATGTAWVFSKWLPLSNAPYA